MNDVPAWLLGRWRLLRAEPGLDFAPGVSMEFGAGGRLRYTFDVGGREQALALVYQVQDGVLRTDNPAHPHAVETRFRLGEGDVLEFDFSGVRAWFVRDVVLGARR